uniref:Astacin domain-containing protein n=1 Tax=Parastrongyloides trichosuri TaxID=131310 RepID=A0A0N4ZAF4_PARTI
YSHIDGKKVKSHNDLTSETIKNIEKRATKNDFNGREKRTIYKYIPLFVNHTVINMVTREIENCSNLRFEKLELNDDDTLDLGDIGPYLMFIRSDNYTSYFENTTIKNPSARIHLDEYCKNNAICTLNHTIHALGFEQTAKCFMIIYHEFLQLPTYYRYFTMNVSDSKIKEATDILNSRTCLTFEKVSFAGRQTVASNEEFEPYIIYDRTTEPNSYNENNTIENTISLVHLANNCVIPTHMRYDRNEYIDVHYENAINDTKTNRGLKFNQKNNDRFSVYNYSQYFFDGTSYEFGSLAHPNKTYYSFNNESTLEAKISEYNFMMGQEYNATFNDIKLINLYYCYNNCTFKEKPYCKNGGYPNPNNCKECLCPDGFEGVYCGTLINKEKQKCGNTTLIAKADLSYLMLHSDVKCKYKIASTRKNQKIQIYLANCTVASKDLCFNDNGIEVKHLKDPGTKGLCLTRELSKPISLTSESNKAFVFYSGRNKETDGCFVLYREKQEKVLNESEIIKEVNKIIEDPTSMPGFMIGFDV